MKKESVTYEEAVEFCAKSTDFECKEDIIDAEDSTLLENIEYGSFVEELFNVSHDEFMKDFHQKLFDTLPSLNELEEDDE